MSALPEPLLHFAIPFASLALARVGYRKALLVSILALTPDLDALLLVHRSQSHSLILLGAVTLAAYLLLRRTRYRAYVLLGSLGVASHIILDIFSWYTPAMWPVLDQSIRVLVELNVHIASQPTMAFNLQLLTRPTVFEAFETIDAPIFTSEGVISSAALLFSTLYATFQYRLRKPLPK